MKPFSHPIAFALYAVLALVSVNACTGTNPEQEARLAVLESKVTEAEETANAVSARIADLRNDRASMQETIADLTMKLAEAKAAGADTSDLEAKLGEQKDALDAVRQLVIEAKEERLDVEREVTSAKNALLDEKAQQTGSNLSGVLGVVELLIGGLAAGGATWAVKAHSAVQAIKAAPSRAKAEVDELWDKNEQSQVALAKLEGRVDALLDALAKGAANPTLPAPPPSA